MLTYFSVFSEDCQLGSEYDSGICVFCKVGFYRNDSTMVRCQSCPYGYLTPDTGAVEISECVVPVSQSGQYRLNVIV